MWTSDKKRLFANRTMDYFLVLVEHMNYTKAAKTLGITQPALTQQIKKLERQAGAAMFYTTGKALHLTEAGQTVLRMTHSIYNVMDRATEELQKTLSATVGSVQVGVLTSLEEKILIDFLSVYHQSHPEVILTIHKLSSDQLWHGLEHNQIDLAVMYLPDSAIKNWASYEMQTIVMDELLLLHPKKEWPEGCSVPLKDVAQDKWITYPENFYIHQCLKEAFTQQMLDFPEIAAYLSTTDQLVQFGSHTGCCTALPKTYVDIHQSKVKMNAVSFAEPIEFQQAFVYRKDKLLIPRVKDFLDSFDIYLSSEKTHERLENKVEARSNV